VTIPLRDKNTNCSIEKHQKSMESQLSHLSVALWNIQTNRSCGNVVLYVKWPKLC